MSELSKEAQALIDAARTAEVPPPEAKARVQALLMTSLASGPAAGASGAAKASTAAKGAAVAAKLGGGKVVGALLAMSLAGGAAVWQAQRSGQPAAPPPAPSPAIAASPTAAPTAPPIAQAPEIAAPLAPAPAAPARPTDLRPAGRRRSQAPEPSPETEPTPAPEPLPAVETIPSAPVTCAPTEDLALLGAAQRELQGNRAARALELLDQHAAACPKSNFLEEERAARILSLCALGRIEDAAEQAARFRADFPKSPQRDRIQASCAGEH